MYNIYIHAHVEKCTDIYTYCIYIYIERERDTCAHIYIYILTEGSLEVKLPTMWTDRNAQTGRSSDREKVRREKIGDGEDQRGRKSEERRCRCVKR